MFSISRIQEVMQLLPRGAFDQAVRAHGGDHHCKGFSSWNHLVAMSYAQLSNAASLRTAEAGFGQHVRHHYHLGCPAFKRSTLAEANGRREPQIFADTAMALMQQAGRAARQHWQSMLYLLDSTSIALRGRGFEWAQASANRTPGLKLHLLYARDGLVPVYQNITATNVNDLDEGKKLVLQAGATYVFDKGYCDYAWWSSFDRVGARFITRAKSNAALRTVEERAIDQADVVVILGDRIERFAHKSNRGGHKNVNTGCVRRVWVVRAGKEPLVLLTNDLDSPAMEIAQLYKERWQIELFFKWIKQHLQVKRFLGRSENAVRIQLLVALIVYLLVLLYKAKNGLTESLWTVLATLRAGLFQRPEQEISAWQRQKRERDYLDAVQPALL